MSHNIRMCSRCKVKPAHNCAYCQTCKNERQRELYRARKALEQPSPRKPRTNQWTHKDNCNCGNPTCTGLTCDRVSA